MRRKIQSIRAVLAAIAAGSTSPSQIAVRTALPLPEVEYHLQLCSEAGYFDGVESHEVGRRYLTVHVSCLNNKGQDFNGLLQNEDAWDWFLATVKDPAAVSMDTAAQLLEHRVLSQIPSMGEDLDLTVPPED